MRERPTEAEQSVLGGVLLDNSVMPIVAEQLRVEDFTDPRHRIVWAVMVEMAKALEPIDDVTVVSWLKQRGQLDAAGGPLYLADVVDRTPTAANITSWVNIVRQAAAIRQLYKASREAMKSIEGGADVDDVFNELEKLKADIRSREPNEMGDIADDLAALLREMEHRHDQGAAVSSESYISTGYASIDRKIIGFGQGQLIIVSAKSGVGKTALVINTAVRQVVDGRRVAFFSGEMSRQAVTRRVLASAAKVNHHVLRKGLFADQDWPRAIHASGKIQRSRFLINDEINTVSDVANIALRTHLLNPLDCVYVDYLQRLVPRESRNFNREQVVAQAAVDMKNLARRLGAPVVVLSQLNADGNLRESAAIFHEADVVLEVDRPGADNPDADQYEATLRVKKQRDGEIGDVPLYWQGQFVRFDEIDPPPPPPRQESWLEKTSSDD